MLDWIIMISYGLLSLALILAFLRLVKGPSLPDRVVALELLASLMIGFIALSVVNSGRAPFLDVAMVIALTGFLAAVGFARYMEKGAHGADH